MDSSRILFYGVWGVGVVLLFGVVIWCRFYIWRHHHDRRSFRDFLEAAALFLVSAAAASAVASFLVYPDDGTTIRGALTSLALGGFLGAGIIMAGDAIEQYRKTRDML